MSDYYIYGITDGFAPQEWSYIKIGISWDAHRRMKQLQTGNPKYLYLDRIYSCVDEYTARAKEKEIHQDLARYRARKSSEWFKYTPDVEKYLDGMEHTFNPNLVEETPEDDDRSYTYRGYLYS